MAAVGETDEQYAQRLQQIEVQQAQPLNVGASPTAPIQQPPATGTGVYAGYDAPRGHWRDTICDCGKNLWPSCCCVFLNGWGFLLMFYAGQISTRLGYVKLTHLVGVYALLLLICFFVSIAGSAQHQNWDAVYLMPGLFTFIFLIMLRFQFVHFHNINENGCETCCIAFWCSSCSLCQMGRHMYGYTKLFDGDGDLEGKMNYAPSAVSEV